MLKFDKMEHIKTNGRPKTASRVSVNLSPAEARLIERLRQLRQQRPQGVIVVVEVGEESLVWRVSGKREG